MADFQINAGQIPGAKNHPAFQEIVGLFRQNRFDAADAACVQLSRQFTNDADIAHMRSVIAYSASRLPDAIKHIRAALKLRPGNAALLSDLGNFLYASGDYANAEIYLTEALKASPRFAGAHFNMGSVAGAMGNLRLAEFHFIQAYQCDPNMIVALFELIDIQIELPRLENARRNAEQVVKVYPKMARAHAVLGQVLAAQEEMEAADEAFQKARMLAPKDMTYVLSYMGFLTQAGRIADAADLLRRSLQREPDNLQLMMRLSRFASLAHDDEYVKKMQQIAAGGDVSNADLVPLYYALGKIFEDNGRYAEAFDYFCKGAETKRKGPGSVFVGANQTITDLEKSFTPELMVRLQNCGVADETPIFVVGLPRSGTTLTEQILTSHPDIAGVGEILELESIAQGVIKAAGGKSLGSALDEIGAERVQEAANSYLDVLKGLAPQSKRIVDKMPVNFNYVGLIAVLFPQARIVHCHRNILDSALSMFKNNFGGNTMWYSYDLDELARFCRRYQQIMEIWHELLPGRIYRHDYDEMVSDQEGCTRALIDACGLDWSDACLRFHKNTKPVKTASVMQVRQPLYAKSSGLSEQYGSALDPLRAALDRAGVQY